MEKFLYGDNADNYPGGVADYYPTDSQAERAEATRVTAEDPPPDENTDHAESEAENRQT